MVRLQVGPQVTQDHTRHRAPSSCQVTCNVCQCQCLRNTEIDVSMKLPARLTINISCLTPPCCAYLSHYNLHSCINYPKRFLMSIQCETPELCHAGLYVPTLQSLSSQYVSLGKYLLCLSIIHFDISRVLWPVHHSPSNIRQSIQQIILYCVQ